MTPKEMYSLNLLKQVKTECREPQAIKSYQCCGITCQKWIECSENKYIHMNWVQVALHTFQGQKLPVITYINKEIIISNTTYKYSRVFSLIYKIWLKISYAFNNFVPDFPVYYSYHTEDTTYFQSNINEEDFSQLVPVHIETRPLKLSANAF